MTSTGVENITTASGSAKRYAVAMEVSQWVAKAIEFAGISQAKLAADLSKELNRSIDRAAVNKMIKGQRKVDGAEFLAIEKITGYPIPADADNMSRAEIIEWIKLLDGLDQTQRQQSFALLQGLRRPHN